jgi:heterodisulfide reductase subunit C/CBS domain-containing protein
MAQTRSRKEKLHMEERTVGQIVRGRPVYVVHEDDSVLDASRYMTEYHLEAVPVLSERELVGIFSERDLMTRVVALGLDPTSTKVGQVMTTKVGVLGMENTCKDALSIMGRLNVRHLPIMDEGRLVGCVSLKELQAAKEDAEQVAIQFVNGYQQKDRRRDMVDKSHESLADRVRAIPGGEHLMMCYSCGTCVGSCPIQLTGELSYNPRRLIQKVIRSTDQEAFEDRTTWLCSACDLCYPACPQKIHISGVLAAVKELAVEAGHRTMLETAVVNEVTCVACGLCVEVCPYEAVTLVERQIMGGTRTLASVDGSRCMACGLCAASCRSSSIELKNEFSSEALMEDLWEWMGRAEPIPVTVEEITTWARSAPGGMSGRRSEAVE